MGDAGTAERFAGGVALKAFVGANPLPGAWFRIGFSTTRDPVVIVVGPADVRGELRLSGSEIAERFDRAAGLALMDHGPWDSTAFVSAIGLASLPDLRRGYESWGRVDGLFPPDYLAQLNQLERVLLQHVGASLRVEAAPSAWLRVSAPSSNRSTH